MPRHLISDANEWINEISTVSYLLLRDVEWDGVCAYFPVGEINAGLTIITHERWWRL